VSPRRRIFSLSETATVVLTAGGRTYSHAFRAGVRSFPLRTSPRVYALRATDAAGNVSRTLRVR